MSGYILCQVKRAKKPYYIESISINIYSIEELCYFLFHNLYLLDSTIINVGLCDWIRDELGLRKLATRLYRLMEEHVSTGEFILPILKEINYLSLEEYKELNQNLATYDGQPDIMREKLKGDCLVGHGKYVNAINVYQKNLLDTKHTKLGGQFIGSIYNNMGIAYIRLFQTEEALECFRLAYENLHSRASLKSYLIAFYMNKPMEEFEEKTISLGVDDSLKNEIYQELKNASGNYGDSQIAESYREALAYKKSGDTLLYQKTIDELLEKLTREYHKNTGL